MHTRFLAAAIAFGACGGSTTPPTHSVTLATTEPSAAASASAAVPTSTAPSNVLATCDMAPPIAVARRDDRKPPTPGAMTEEAARAKRLYDAEKWLGAIHALERVASGETGDDEGNKEIAGYHVATALYYLHRYTDSYAAFHAIAQNRNHVKQRETILWLTKIARDQPELVQLGDFGFYTREDIAMFNNVTQLEVYDDLLFLLARSRMRSHELDEAAALLGQVPPQSRFGQAAQQCAEIVRRAAR